MPLKWERGMNPYLHTYFARLRIGPNVPAAQIAQQARQLKQLLKTREIPLGDGKLDEHAVSEAATKLMRDPPALAEELLLAHALPRDEGGKLKKTCDDLRQIATLPEDRQPLPLAHQLGIFWFVPPPGPDAAALPAWEDFALVPAGADQDIALDIVFDS
jgi:hypothetical protein